MSVSFAYGGVTKYLQNPVYQSRYKLHKDQVVGRTGGGNVYVADLGEDWEALHLKFEGLRESEKDDLQSFFESTAQAFRYEFTYIDEESTTWYPCRFLTDALEFTALDDAQASAGTFSSGGTDYPTTTREEPVYSVGFDIQIEEMAP